MRFCGSSPLLLLALAAPLAAQQSAPAEVKADPLVFELLLDRTSYPWQAGLTPSGVAFKAAPLPQPGIGARVGWTALSRPSWAMDLTGGFHVGSLGNVMTEGTKAGMAIKAGSDLSATFGAAWRTTGRLEAGLGLDGRLSSLATQLDGEAASRSWAISPWVRGFVGLWSSENGRFVRLEGGYNLLKRTAPEREYTNPRWTPWGDPSSSPATVTTASRWEPRWYLGISVGFRPAPPIRVMPVATVQTYLAPSPIPPVQPTQRVEPRAPEVLPAPVAVTKSTSQTTGPSTFRVYFPSGQSRLTNEAQVVIRAWVKAQAEAEARSVVVVGHTDLIGEVKANLRLSRRRAAAVATYLCELGIHCEQVKTVGVGSKEPLSSNRTKQGRAANRRVDAIGSNLTNEKR